MIRYVLSSTGAALLVAASAYAQEPPPLRTAVDGTFAPHAFPNLSGGYQGFNIHLANEIAKRLKRKILIDAAQFSGLVPALQAGYTAFITGPTKSRHGAACNVPLHRCYSHRRLLLRVQETSR